MNRYEQNSRCELLQHEAEDIALLIWPQGTSRLREVSRSTDFSSRDLTSFFRLPKDCREGQTIVHLTSYCEISLKYLSTSGNCQPGKAVTKGPSLYFCCLLYFLK